MRWYQGYLSAWQRAGRYERYFENGFDYFPSPVVTADEPDKLTMSNWGFYKDHASATKNALNTLNCISGEMWDKPTFKEAVAKGQRCLIPVTGFYEWRWLDEEGQSRIKNFSKSIVANKKTFVHK